MAIPRWSGGFSTEFSVAKVSFLIVGLFSIAGAARIALPIAFKVFASGLLRFGAAAQPWIEPPYLFITVHLIILIIWKLSDQMHHHHHRSTVKATPLGHSSSTLAPSPLDRKPSLETWSSSSASPVNENPVKAAPLDPSSPVPPIDEVKVAPLGQSVASVVKRKPSLEKKTQIWHENQVKATPFASSTLESPEPHPLITSPDGFEIKRNTAEPTPDRHFAKSMEATWKAIFDNFSPEMDVEGEERMEQVQAKGASAVVESDELHRLCDDFIKKKYDQMRVESAGAARRY